MILKILTDENEIGCKPRASGDDPLRQGAQPVISE